MTESESLRSFFAMGGYAIYVWGAYCAAAAIIGGMAIATLFQWRRARARLRALEAETRQTPQA